MAISRVTVGKSSRNSSSPEPSSSSGLEIQDPM
jgi:hypothetical protein